MIDARELRIGNYVNKDQIVVGICPDMIETTKDAEMPIENIEPIPLTEEWLERFEVKFGFGKYMIEHMFNKYHLRYNYDIGMSAYIAELPYVHTLQNLFFALVGEELKLEK